jgi:Ser/Thr protein kinase RdoA (MazF antagonist)
MGPSRRRHRPHPFAREVVARLLPRWRTFWPDADLEAAADDVAARLADAAGSWDLQGLVALDGGNVAVVCAARRRGRAVVVKVHARGHPEEAELRSEAAALAFWQPTGAVPELLDIRDDGLTTLMARVVPGTALDAARVGIDERLAVLGRLAGRLHAAGTPPDDALPLGTYARGWRRALGDDPEALAELDGLLAPEPGDVLIHADLHGGNALLAGDGWKAIDPHAARADPHADVWALLDPLVPALPGDGPDAARTARGWVERYARAARLDPSRTAAWTRLRARATAAGIDAQAAPSAADRSWAERLGRMARALA